MILFHRGFMVNEIFLSQIEFNKRLFSSSFTSFSSVWPAQCYEHLRQDLFVRLNQPPLEDKLSFSLCFGTTGLWSSQRGIEPETRLTTTDHKRNRQTREFITHSEAMTQRLVIQASPLHSVTKANTFFPVTTLPRECWLNCVTPYSACVRRKL